MPENSKKMDLQSILGGVAMFGLGFLAASFLRRGRAPLGTTAAMGEVGSLLQNKKMRLARLIATHGHRSHKMVLVVRTDVGMKHGKMAAQSAHAALMLYKKAIKTHEDDLDIWEATGCTKVCVKFADGEDALYQLKKTAEERNIVTAMVRDAGHTQVAAGTVTVLGLGPARKEVIDEVAGHLKLL